MVGTDSFLIGSSPKAPARDTARKVDLALKGRLVNRSRRLVSTAVRLMLMPMDNLRVSTQRTPVTLTGSTPVVMIKLTVTS